MSRKPKSYQDNFLKMNEQDISAQITKMKNFILKEAREQSEEIEESAKNEASVQGSNLVQSETIKLRIEECLRIKQLDSQKRIYISVNNNKVRLDTLQALKKGAESVFMEAHKRLSTLTQGESYKKLLVDLVIQGLVAINENKVILRCREQDKDLLESLIPNIINEFSVGWASENTKNLNLVVDKVHFVRCTGGVVLSAIDDRIICNNTLDVRLQYAYEGSMPRIRNILYGDLVI